METFSRALRPRGRSRTKIQAFPALPPHSPNSFQRFFTPCGLIWLANYSIRRTEAEAEDQRGSVTCLRSHSQSVERGGALMRSDGGGTGAAPCLPDPTRPPGWPVPSQLGGKRERGDPACLQGTPRLLTPWVHAHHSLGPPLFLCKVGRCQGLCESTGGPESCRLQ